MKKTNHLEAIWNRVPADYYEKGIRGNFFQFLWHSHKVNTFKKLTDAKKFKTILDVGCGSHLHPFKHNELEMEINRVGFKIRNKHFSFFGMEVSFVLSK